MLFIVAVTNEYVKNVAWCKDWEGGARLIKQNIRPNVDSLHVILSYPLGEDPKNNGVKLANWLVMNSLQGSYEIYHEKGYRKKENEIRKILDDYGWDEIKKPFSYRIFNAVQHGIK